MGLSERNQNSETRFTVALADFLTLSMLSYGIMEDICQVSCLQKLC